MYGRCMQCPYKISSRITFMKIAKPAILLRKHETPQNIQRGIRRSGSGGHRHPLHDWPSAAEPLDAASAFAGDQTDDGRLENAERTGRRERRDNPGGTARVLPRPRQR